LYRIEHVYVIQEYYLNLRKQKRKKWDTMLLHEIKHYVLRHNERLRGVGVGVAGQNPSDHYMAGVGSHPPSVCL